MKKKDIHILYLVKRKKGNLLKIGLTKKSNFNSRIYNISKDFGDIDYSNSYICYSNNEKDINNLEKLLHKTFYKSRRSDFFKEGVGKTEWFNSNISTDVKKQIIYLRKKNKNYKTLSSLKKMDSQKKSFYIFPKFLSIFSFSIYILLFVSLFLMIYT